MMTDLLHALTVLAAAVTVAGCSQSIEGGPVPESQKVHCDLIFPGTDRR